MIKYVKGYVACIECTLGRFPNGSKHLYGGPFPTEQLAKDWSDALYDAKLVRIECNEVPEERVLPRAAWGIPEEVNDD